jgi:hypothetical protein
MSLSTEAQGVIPIPLPTQIAARSRYTSSAGAPNGPSTFTLISLARDIAAEVVVVVCSIVSVIPTARATSSVQSPTHLMWMEIYSSEGAEVIVNGCHCILLIDGTHNHNHCPARYFMDGLVMRISTTPTGIRIGTTGVLGGRGRGVHVLDELSLQRRKCAARIARCHRAWMPNTRLFPQ